MYIYIYIYLDRRNFMHSWTTSANRVETTCTSWERMTKMMMTMKVAKWMTTGILGPIYSSYFLTYDPASF